MNQKFKSNLGMDEDSSELEFHHQNQHNNPYSSGYSPFTDFITEKVSDEVASAVVSDATYRVKELIQNCRWWISQKNNSVLTVEDVNKVLEKMNYPAVLGENHQDVPAFWNIGGVLVEDDPDVDLCNAVINDPGTYNLNGGLYVKNELIMGKGEDGNVSQLPDTLVRCYESIRTILCGCNEQHFRSLSLSLKSNSLLGPILPYVVDDIAEQIKLASGNEVKLYCLFDVVYALVSNEYVDLSKSVSINKLMANLLSVAFSPNLGRDEDLRRKSADMLGRAMLRWPNILLVREVLHKLNKCLQDSLLPLQVQRGALHILATMGNASLALVLWPLLLNRPTYGHFLEAIRSRSELAADFAAIQDTLLVCSLALQGAQVGLNIPIKNVASVATSGFPDAVHRLFTDLLGEDVMCCRWPAPPSLFHPAPKKRKLLPFVKQAPAARLSVAQRYPTAKASVVQKRQHGLMNFKVLRLKEARVRKLDSTSFQGHTRFQRLCSVHMRHGRQHKMTKLRLAVNLRNVL